MNEFISSTSHKCTCVHALSVHTRASSDIAHVYYIGYHTFSTVTPLRFSVLLCQNQNVFLFKFQVLLSQTSEGHKASVSEEDVGVLGGIGV